jgi:hypothetical protein
MKCELLAFTSPMARQHAERDEEAAETVSIFLLTAAVIINRAVRLNAITAYDAKLKFQRLPPRAHPPARIPHRGENRQISRQRRGRPCL